MPDYTQFSLEREGMKTSLSLTECCPNPRPFTKIGAQST